MKLNIVTLFPEIFEKHLEYLPFKKAIELNKIEVNLIGLRNFALDSYGTVDGKPYGGGKGMLLMVEPIFNALQTIKPTSENRKTILLSPRGKKYTQKVAREYQKLDELTLICGRYEGVDERVNNYCDEMISIGDYVLSGGELPALIIMESITRLQPGVLDDETTAVESFSEDTLEYPQYTRPEEFKGHKVPQVLVSGNHAEIKKWRKENSKDY